MTDAVALWFQGNGCFTVQREALPPPGPDTCTVEALYSGISPGTERLVYHGGVPSCAYDAMRCPYMGGVFPYPVKYGYSLVGRVTDGPASLRGRMVHVLHPHQSHCRVLSTDVYPLPLDVPPRRATLASNLETAVTAVWDTRAGVGDRVLVVGFGVLGSLVARLLSSIAGLDLMVMERSPERRERAHEMGFKTASEADLDPKFDITVNASGTGAGLQRALDHLALEGRVVDLSWYGTQEVTLRLGDDYHYRRKSIVSSQVGHIPSARRARWDRRRRKDLVFSLLQTAVFDEHLDPSIPFAELPQVLPRWLASTSRELACTVAYAPSAH